MKAEKIYDETFTARNFNTSPLTISGLEGDLYDYELIVQWNFSSATANALRLNFNSDTTTNYRSYRMRGYSTTANASVSDSLGYIEVGSIKSTIEALSIVNITGSSGDERYVDCFYSGENSVADQVAKISGHWKNTGDEITSLTLDHITSATSDAHIILYRTPKEASQEKWELVDKLSWSASSTEQAFTTDGNTDIQYRLVWKGNQELNIELNNDATSNYTRQYLQNSSATLSAANASNTSIVTDGREAEVIINAESGVKRLCTSSASNISAAQQSERAIWWGNTADNLTSIDCTPSSSATGTAWLYRRKNPNTIGDTLPFEMVEEVAVSGDFSAGHTFNVSGDDVLLYKLEWLGANTSSSIDLRMQFNGDTGSNYPRQYLYGTSSTVSAQSATATQFSFANPENADQSYACTYIYPKSGRNRPILNTNIFDENAIRLQAAWWNNTADSINSIKTYALNTDSLTGTLKLSRLYKGLRKQVNTFGFGASKGAYTADSTDFQMTTMSATAWVYLNSGYNTDGAIQGQFGASGNRSWYYRVDSGKTVAALFCSNGSTIGTGNIMTTTTTLNTEQWYMLTFVLDGSNCYIYINDGLDLTKAYSSGLFNSTNNFEIGYLSNYSVNFDGDITGVQVYKNTALTADDVSQLYNNGIVRKYSSLPTGLQGTAAWELTDRDNTGNDLGSTNNLTFVGSTTDDGVSILYNK